MSKLYSSDEITLVLKKLCFYVVSQRGSHGKFKNKFGKIVILPMNKKEIPIGTFKSILKQMEVSYEEFRRLLEE